MKTFLCINLNDFHGNQNGPKTNAEIQFVSAADQNKANELIHEMYPTKAWFVIDKAYADKHIVNAHVDDEEPKKYKLHARVTREIEVTEDQMERLCNYFCGSTEHNDIEDIRCAFTDGIDSGNYDDAGYVPQPWIEADFEALPEDDEIRMYLKGNQCNFDQIDL